MKDNNLITDQYKLRLFLAVDLQSSTALKFRFPCEGMSFWRSFLRSFYHDFAVHFLQCLGKVKTECKVDPLNPVSLWKSSGDEIVMVVAIAEKTHLKYYLRSFRDAVRLYNDQLAQRDHVIFRIGGETLRLRLKPRAWLADFPIGNMEFSVPHGELKYRDDTQSPWPEEKPDYFGPAMDVGFRLGSLATSRKFVLSVETVWALVTDQTVIQDFRIFMEGRFPLKGVRGGEPYPVFWLDVKKEVTAEDQWAGLNPLDLGDYPTIKALCEEFIGLKENPLLTPIFQDNEPLPPEFTEAMFRMQEI